MDTLFDMGIPDKPLTGIGENRSRSGAVMDAVIKALFGLSDGIPNGKAPTCPDAYTKLDTPVEIKSLRRRDKLVVYDWRLEKDVPGTLYFIGIHDRGPATTLREIWESVSSTLSEVLVVRCSDILRLSRLEPLRKIQMETTASGKKNGYQRKGYNRGYRNVPHQAVHGLCSEAGRVSATLHGLEFSASVKVGVGVTEQLLRTEGG